MLFHNVVSPQHPNVYFTNQKIEYVDRFKYRGIELRNKLGWGIYINTRIARIRNLYCGLRKLYQIIPKEEIPTRRLLFLTFALPHFIWLFSLWFLFTENQKKGIEHVYVSGIRLVYSLWGWEDLTTLIVAREKTLNDYIYNYLKNLKQNLDISLEASAFNETFEVFMIITSPELYNLYYKKHVV